MLSTGGCFNSALLDQTSLRTLARQNRRRGLLARGGDR